MNLKPLHHTPYTYEANSVLIYNTEQVLDRLMSLSPLARNSSFVKTKHSIEYITLKIPYVLNVAIYLNFYASDITASSCKFFCNNSNSDDDIELFDHATWDLIETSMENELTKVTKLANREKTRHDRVMTILGGVK